MSELGLRYRPAATADQEDHQTATLLLAKDLAHLDANTLSAAADHWVQRNRWMPKAFDLIELCRKLENTDKHALQMEHVRRGNAYLATIGRRDCQWYIHNGQVKIGAAL